MSDAPVALAPEAPPTDAPTRLQRLQARLEDEVKSHNELHSSIQDGEKQLEQARNRLFQIQGRAELLKEQIAEEGPQSVPDSTPPVDDGDNE